MIKTLHIAFALLTVVGFVMRAGWTYSAPEMLKHKWVRIAPHVVDTMLLILGVTLAFGLPDGPLQGWLGAKLVALLLYIGFGVITLRGSGALKHFSVIGALACVGYIFLVAFSRQAWPF